MEIFNYDGIKKTEINLIPNPESKTGSYACTWWSQSACAGRLKLTGEGLSEWRDALNEYTLFDDESFYHHVPRKERKDLIFLVDDGWDIPKGTPNDSDHRYLYGSIDPDPEKFSRFGSTPEERLTGMSQAVKELGYAGLGLWISPQETGREEYKEADARAYWEKRAKWCHNAGILYWKVDWGNHDYDDDYRELITDCAHRLAPDLLVEHAVIQMPVTHTNHSKDFKAERPQRVQRLMTFSDAYRTYDIMEPFDKVCTLERAHEALVCSDTEHKGLGLINGENLYPICASLGLTTGIMNYNTEALACIRWHRIAPPFGIFEGKYKCSEEWLSDSLFCERELCSWSPCKGRTVVESAPAIMARNCPLPKVSPLGSIAPFVLASKNPKTQAYSVATVQRTVDPNTNIYFPADVTVTEGEIDAPIGVFGIFNSLTVEFLQKIPENAKILAQDLTTDEAKDITELVKLNGNSLTLDGKLLRVIAKGDKERYDDSAPAVVVSLRNDD